MDLKAAFKKLGVSDPFGAYGVREVDGDLKAGEPLGLHEDWIGIASTVLGEDVVSS